MPNLSHFPEDKQEISIYLYWDKDSIALAKKKYPIYTCIFSYSSKITYVVGTH